MGTSTLVRDVSAMVGLSEEKLVQDSISAYLWEKKRQLMAEKFEILARYEVNSAEGIKERIAKGEIHDHPAWEDYIELTNLASELQRTENALRAVVQPA